MSKHISQRTYTTTLNEGAPFLKALRLTDWEVNYGSTMLLLTAASILRGRSSSL